MSIGTEYFRTSTLSCHVSVSEHQTLVSAPREWKNLEKAVAVMATREEKVVTVAMKAALWLCTENLPMPKFISLLKLLRILQVADIDALTLNPSANIDYTSYKSVHGFINVMSEMIDANLVKKAADSPVITVLTDESNDIVVNHRLVINIRIVNLLLDSHESHTSLEVILFTRDNGVVMLTFPPHCTHRLQPLDSTSLRSLKAGYSQACHNWMPYQNGWLITQFDVIKLFTMAYNTSATVASATDGFSAARLWPFNDSKFDDELGNNDEAAHFVPVRNHVGDEDDMLAESVVNDVVQRPIDRASSDDSVQETIGDTRSASMLTVLADVHSMPVAATIDQDVIQPEPIFRVTQKARAISIGVATDDLDRGRLVTTVQDDDAIVSLPSFHDEQDNQDPFRQLV